MLLYCADLHFNLETDFFFFFFSCKPKHSKNFVGKVFLIRFFKTEFQMYTVKIFICSLWFSFENSKNKN